MDLNKNNLNNNINPSKSYAKHNSFKNFKSKNSLNSDQTINKILEVKKSTKILSNLSVKHREILDKALSDLMEKNEKKIRFKLSEHVLSEIHTLPESSLLKYIVHRYRYEIFPQIKEIDDFPPYLQIEPSSVCNFRCVFCFETDTTFTNKKNGFMGRMTYDLFKKIIDNAEGRVEFISLASRGEPLACQDIEKMLIYTKGKFLKNIERFQKIRETKYPKNPIISRVSGVKYSKEQKFDDMINLWDGLVDQIAFVDYNPWENSYQKEPNHLKSPCSDLWRRMFVWWDGKVNPCDVDYKSKLSVGIFPDKELSEIWKSNAYNHLRQKHIKKQRSKLIPCQSCTVI